MSYEDNAINTLKMLGVELTDGDEEVDQKAYNMPMENPKCPCCGVQLKIVDTLKNSFGDDLAVVAESRKLLKENKLTDFLLQEVEAIAKEIYEDEIKDNAPDSVDSLGNASTEYRERFKYPTPEIKACVKRKALYLANKMKECGVDIHPWNCEEEIYQALECFSY